MGYLPCQLLSRSSNPQTVFQISKPKILVGNNFYSGVTLADWLSFTETSHPSQRQQQKEVWELRLRKVLGVQSFHQQSWWIGFFSSPPGDVFFVGTQVSCPDEPTFPVLPWGASHLPRWSGILQDGTSQACFLLGVGSFLVCELLKSSLWNGKKNSLNPINMLGTWCFSQNN